MPDRRWPSNGENGLTQTVSEGLNLSSLFQAVGNAVANISEIHTLVLSPYVGDIIPDLIADVVPAPETLIARSDSPNQVVTAAKQLRGLVFANYAATPLYLQIHGVTPEPAVGVQPGYPPIPVAQNQVFIADQSLLGYDGFGYSACTIRVSTTLINYTATAATPGLWSLIARFK